MQHDAQTGKYTLATGNMDRDTNNTEILALMLRMSQA